ncbi:hypothetical protein ACET3Z_025720 [Daucus carota]
MSRGDFLGDYSSGFQNLNLKSANWKGHGGGATGWTREEINITNFIWANTKWVDKQILERLNVGDRAAIISALEQIHWRSLEDKHFREGGARKSCGEILRQPNNPMVDKEKRILDIIVPKKRDRKGIRYGFVHTSSELEAGAIIFNAKMNKRLGSKIRMSINPENQVLRNSGENPNRDGAKSKIQGIKADDNSGGEVEFEKKLFEFTEMEIDTEVEKALSECKMGYTWKFLIRKDKSDSWEELETTDLSVWFCKLGNFEETDYTMSRIAWIECRGLPMPAWKDENLKAFTRRYGRWVSWTYQSDNLKEFFNPLVCIDTMSIDAINDKLAVLYKGKQIVIDFKEIEDISRLKGKILPMEFLSSSHPVRSQAESINKNGDTDTGMGKEPQSNNSEDKGIANNEGSGFEDKENKEEKVFENIDEQVNVIEVKGEEPKISHDKNSSPSRNIKKVRSFTAKEPVKEVTRQRSILSLSISPTSREVADTKNSEKSEVYQIARNVSSHSSLCIDIHKKLKVKSNRGRPKKINPIPRNPFETRIKFKNKKTKGRGKRGGKYLGCPQIPKKNLQLVPAKVIGGTVKEALEILSSVEGMGLEVASNREEALKVIFHQLDSGEL